MTFALITIVFLLLCLALSLYYVYKFARIILRIEDAIEQSLDALDERYRSMSKVLEIPIFYDSPQIRQVVNDIKATRDTLLLIANRFASIDDRAVEDGEASDDQES